MSMRIAALIALFLLTGCQTLDVKPVSTVKEYKVNVERVVHDIHIAWGLEEAVPTPQQRSKLETILKILRKAHGVEVLILPVYNLPLTNKFVHDRVHIIKDKLMDMGVGADKIAIAKPVKVSEKKKPGINVVITEFVMHIPECTDWDVTVGDFDTTKDLPNFGCYTAGYFGKMVANPASIVKYRKTDSDTTIAIQAVETYAAVEGVNARAFNNGTAINANGINPLQSQNKISDSLGRIGRGSAGVADTIRGAL